MKKTDSSPEKKNRARTNMILWTFTAAMWTIVAVRQVCYPAANRQDFLPVLAAILSVVAALSSWRNWHSQKKAENGGDGGEGDNS